MSEDSPFPAKNGGDAGGQMLLWGTWELWCDLPQSSNGGNGVNINKSDAPLTVAGGRGKEKLNWLSQVKSIGLFDSAEGFWGLFNCVLLPSQLPPNGSYYLFRKHIAPMWEHEANRRGGKWVIPFTHGTTASDDIAPCADPALPVDVAWLKLCLAVIGELLPCEETEICGLTVSRGKNRAGNSNGEWKLCLWTRSADDEAVQRKIAEFVKGILESEIEISRSDSSLNASPAVPDRQRAKSGINMTFTAHRDLMVAKQKFAQGGHSTQPFRPLYTL